MIHCLKQMTNNGYIVDHLHHTFIGVNNKWRYPKTEEIQTAKPEQIVKCGNGTTHQTPGKDHFQLGIEKTLKKHLYIIYNHIYPSYSSSRENL